MGDSLAHYLGRVLGGKKAVVLYKDNGYGRLFASRFRSASERLRISTTFCSFTTAPQRAEAARSAASDPEQPPILLGITYDDAVPVVELLRHLGLCGSVCQQEIGVGRFHGVTFESAPLQILAVPHPDVAEITSGEVFALEPGRYARLQRVVYTGMFLNEILRMDLTRSSFGADFYLWLRFARVAGPNSADPTDINFRP